MSAARGKETLPFFELWRVLVAASFSAAGHVRKLSVRPKDTALKDWGERSTAAPQFFQFLEGRASRWDPATLRAFQRERARSPSAALYLVVDSEAVAEKLRRARPQPVGAAVLVFPPWRSAREHLSKEGPVRRALKNACVLENPSQAELEAVWSSVESAWSTARRPGHYVSIRKVLQGTDGSEAPLRREWAAGADAAKALKRLAGLEGLSTAVRDGHFFYELAPRVSGRLSCKSFAFFDLVKRINAKKPKTAAQFLSLL